MAKFIVNADYLAVAGMFSGEDKFRPHISGVHIKPHNGGALMVATDGHRMALVFDASGYAERAATYRFDHKAKVLKTGRGEVQRVVHIDDDAAIIRDCYPDGPNLGPMLDMMRVEENTSTFPDWTRVCPSYNGAPQAFDGFDGNYLADFATAFKRLTSQRTSGLAIYQGGTGEPAWIANPNAPQARFVLMPMRKATTDARPGWLSECAPMAVAAE